MTTTTTTNTNPIMELLKNRFRDVTTIDPIKGEITTYKAVSLRAKDFEAKNEWKAYSERLVRFAPLMQAAANSQDKDDETFFAARRDAIEALQRVFGLLSNIAQYPKFNATKRDFNYILKFAYIRKIDREGRAGTIVTVKSKAALQNLIEDLMYYHINHMKIPEVTLTATTESAIAKLDAEATKATTDQASNAKPQKEIKPDTMKEAS